jgi:sigma-B regulation protein RsbU (phosphoserine phosphatase)
MFQNEKFDQTLKREIHLARNIQMKLLNGEKPVLESGEISGISLPARLIGGDYFDFYPLSNGKIRMIIGDVMGKGIPAAMLMILTRGAFRSAAESTNGPGETLTAMNNAMYKDLRKLSSFVTVFCADWDHEAEMLTYANAGHIPPIIVRDHSEISEPPRINGVMLGGLPNQQYMEAKTKLKAEDLVFFYTDGIVEAQNQDGEMYKLERLQKELLQHGKLSVGEIEKNVVDSIQEFTEGLPQKDDITMVILKINSLVLTR